MDEAMKRKRRSRSDVAREARLRRTKEKEWRRLLHYGEQRARAQGVGPEDVVRLVDEYRAGDSACQSRGPTREAGSVRNGRMN